ncbi:Aquaporin PIP2-4 [Coccomyxa sp. Obi]|nr:Aquaporin PIP2-4 [Coccomyxa sp. Obi]
MNRGRMISGKVLEVLIDKEDRSWGTLAKAVLAEYASTTIFLFIAIGTISSNCHTADNVAHSGADKSLKNAEYGSCFLGTGNVLNIAMAFGFGIFVLVYFAASFSVLYMVFQCLGASTGAGFVKAVDKYGWRAAGGGANVLHISHAAGWGLETILTMALVFTVFAATDAERAVDTAHLPVLAPFAIGMVVLLCHLVAIPLDGCSINPARTFGASLVSGNWHGQWVFWAGPISGSILAVALYELAFRTRRHKEVAYPGEADLEGGRRQPQVPAQLPAYAGVEGLNEVKTAHKSR